MTIKNQLIIKIVFILGLLTVTSYADQGKLGLRYWHSEGETEWSHCASSACGGSASLGDPTSKLNYSDTKVGIAEIFGSYKFPSAYILMGKYGINIIDNDGGTFRDQDWNGSNVLSSDTLSDIKNSKVNYYSADLGLVIDKINTGTNITPFLGYVRYNEKLAAYGLRDTNTGSVSVANSTNVIKNDITWTGFRAGAEVNHNINKDFNVILNAAYVFGLDADNKDSHVLRTSSEDLGPAPNIKNVGNGDYGYMIDILGEYNYSTQLRFDFGYRWWMFDTDGGNTKFGPTFATAFPNRSLKSERSGLLIGANYSF